MQTHHVLWYYYALCIIQWTVHLQLYTMKEANEEAPFSRLDKISFHFTICSLANGEQHCHSLLLLLWFTSISHVGQLKLTNTHYVQHFKEIFHSFRLNYTLCLANFGSGFIYFEQKFSFIFLLSPRTTLITVDFRSLGMYLYR